jgi:CheY-like chemotaxis protein
MLDRILGEDIDVELDLEEDIWTVNADSGNIDQVITNLSMNARDAMPEGGSLTIQTRNVWVDESFCLLISDARPGNFACLTVTDTGTGMSEEVLTRLFEPFFTTKAAGKGTGLGLSVVYGIVQSHEGRVTVESKLEKGSKLSLFLPTVEDEAIRTGEEPVVDLDQFRGNGEQVLLIEDEPALRAMTAQALSDNGYEVHACGTAGEATDAFRQVSFDLVLSDVGLPDGRGTDVVFGFLSEKPNLPAILVTGYTDERSEWERVQDAGLLILQKTVPMSDLLKCVHQALQTNGA